MKSLVTQERLKELLIYARKIGRFYWRKTCGPAGAGTQAGTNSEGYIRIGIDGRRYLAHRLAWLYVHGEHPAGKIDHHNGIRADNRIVNLRPPRGPENTWNRQSRNPTGYKGVYRTPSGKFRAGITWYGSKIHIGTYNTAKEAARNYDVHAWVLFGDFARPNGSLARIKAGDGVKKPGNSRRKRGMRKRASARRRCAARIAQSRPRERCSSYANAKP
jgi:HNH endonuclease